MKKIIATTASAAAITCAFLSSANAASQLSVWGTVTQVIVRTDEAKIYFDVTSIPNPASCSSNDSVAIILPTSPSTNNYYETMVASALSALAGNLDVKFNIVDNSCSPTNRPVANQVRLQKPA